MIISKRLKLFCIIALYLPVPVVHSQGFINGKRSPCSRRCGLGYYDWKKICIAEFCASQLISNATVECRNPLCTTQPTSYDKLARRSFCDPNSTLLQLYVNGSTLNPPTYPYISSANNFCQSFVNDSGVYFTVESGLTRPYTIWKIVFSATSIIYNLEHLKYKMYGRDQWFYYPSNSNRQKINLTLENTAQVLNFDKPFEVIKLEIKIGDVDNKVDQICFQVDLFGCHLPYPPKLLIDGQSVKRHEVYVDVNSPSFSQSFTCGTHFQPYYHEHLQMTDLVTGRQIIKTQGSDPTNYFNTYVVEKNDDSYNGYHSLVFEVKLSSYNDMRSVFPMVSYFGYRLFVGMFQCDGRLEDVNSWLYAHNDPAQLHIILIQELDGCQTGFRSPNCSKHALCSSQPGSHSCQCQKPYVGDGHTCDWYQDLPYYTGLFPNQPIQDIYCRMMLFAGVSQTLYVCTRHHNATRNSGCAYSTDLGDTWTGIYPRIDTIYGEDSYTGRVLAVLSTESKNNLFMFLPNDYRLLAITQNVFDRTLMSANFTRNGIVSSFCQIADKSDNDIVNPPDYTTMPVYTFKFAMVRQGITRFTTLSGWQLSIAWEKLPLKP